VDFTAGGLSGELAVEGEIDPLDSSGVVAITGGATITLAEAEGSRTRAVITLSATADAWEDTTVRSG
jgi:hypothetical protein